MTEISIRSFVHPQIDTKFQKELSQDLVDQSENDVSYVLSNGTAFYSGVLTLSGQNYPCAYNPELKKIFYYKENSTSHIYSFALLSSLEEQHTRINPDYIINGETKKYTDIPDEVKAITPGVIFPFYDGYVAPIKITYIAEEDIIDSISHFTALTNLTGYDPSKRYFGLRSPLTSQTIGYVFNYPTFSIPIPDPEMVFDWDRMALSFKKLVFSDLAPETEEATFVHTGLYRVAANLGYFDGQINKSFSSLNNGIATPNPSTSGSVLYANDPTYYEHLDRVKSYDQYNSATFQTGLGLMSFTDSTSSILTSPVMPGQIVSSTKGMPIAIRPVKRSYIGSNRAYYAKLLFEDLTIDLDTMREVIELWFKAVQFSFTSIDFQIFDKYGAISQQSREYEVLDMMYADLSQSVTISQLCNYVGDFDLNISEWSRLKVCVWYALLSGLIV